MSTGLFVFRTFKAYCHLVFQGAFERKTLRMMAGDEVAGRHFSEPRHFCFTASIIRITATGVFLYFPDLFFLVKGDCIFLIDFM
jgi:hypothetical protein